MNLGAFEAIRSRVTCTGSVMQPNLQQQCIVNDIRDMAHVLCAAFAEAEARLQAIEKQLEDMKGDCK